MKLRLKFFLSKITEKKKYVKSYKSNSSHKSQWYIGHNLYKSKEKDDRP